MTSAAATDVVHHLYRRGPALDIIPACGVTPGPDATTGDWNTGHDLDELLQCLEFGPCCCATCLSTDVLGGWTPLVFDPEDDEREGV